MEQRRLRRLIADLMWYMRGSLTRNDAWALSHIEREDMLALIDERLKAVEKTRLPIL